MRNVRVTPKYEQELNAMRGYPRIAFAIEGIKQSLLVRPEKFRVIIGREVRVAKLVAFEGVPDATIYFIYDENHVTLLSIQLN